MTGDKANEGGFVFPPDLKEAVERELDTQRLKAISVAPEVAEHERGYDPYNTGVHRALSFSARTRSKP